MRATKKENNSALKRLIPAVAMLALSAVTLSTSTYAWFTMSKEVKVEGLNMSATAGGGMEIALSSIKKGGAMSFTYGDDAHPSDTDADEIGWRSSVYAGDYYEQIGKLKPASSTDGVKLFDAENASNSGKTASKFKAIDLGTDNMAGYKTKNTFLEVTTAPAIGVHDKDGYYIDIPVHLRTSQFAPSADKTKEDIYYKMIIKNYSSDTVGSADGELYKAVRIAFIESGSAKQIYTCDDVNNYYEKGASKGKAVSSTTEKNEVSILTNNSVANTELSDSNLTYSSSGLQIDYATANKPYGHLDFIVRVWLEGESTACFNKNAGQAWNIDFAFNLGNPNAT